MVFGIPFGEQAEFDKIVSHFTAINFDRNDTSSPSLTVAVSAHSFRCRAVDHDQSSICPREAETVLHVALSRTHGLEYQRNAFRLE